MTSEKRCRVGLDRSTEEVVNHLQFDVEPTGTFSQLQSTAAVARYLWSSGLGQQRYGWRTRR